MEVAFPPGHLGSKSCPIEVWGGGLELGQLRGPCLSSSTDQGPKSPSGAASQWLSVRTPEWKPGPAGWGPWPHLPPLPGAHPPPEEAPGPPSSRPMGWSQPPHPSHGWQPSIPLLACKKVSRHLFAQCSGREQENCIPGQQGQRQPPHWWPHSPLSLPPGLPPAGLGLWG